MRRRGAIGQIERLAEHLPLECPRADVGIVYHPESQELFSYNDESDRFLADLRGVYRTLWTHGISADIITPRMDWSGYRLLILPNVTLMNTETQERIERTLQESPETHFVAEGSFGMYSADGQSSYCPPEGFADQFGVRVADFSAVTPLDIERGRNIIENPLRASGHPNTVWICYPRTAQRYPVHRVFGRQYRSRRDERSTFHMVRSHTVSGIRRCGKARTGSWTDE